MKNIAIIILIILGFLFPIILITAIRSDNDSELTKYKFLSGLLFSIIVCMMAMLVNS